jgi:hypothetical protein
MKRFATTLLLLGLCFLTTLDAAPVDAERAARAAVHWMLARGGSEYTALSVDAVYPFTRDGVTTHYIVNLAPRGFVIVAGDDIAVPVLMYTADGRYDGAFLPPALAEMLALYADDLAQDIAEGVSQPEPVGVLWKELMRDVSEGSAYFGGGGGNSIAAVSPLIAATWNQTTPYNQDCPATPTGGSGGHTYVGCVATAMAMVMHYWGHPATGVGSHSYTHPTYGVQSADFGATTYAWSSMPNSINTSSPAAAKAAIAQLSYHCGVSVNMDYSPTGSGASTDDARDALVNHFRYKSSAQYRTRSAYTTSVWTSLLVGELNAGRPVMYRGSAQNGSGGHAFIVDGFTGTEYFHMNFGWGGSYNGYFYLADITPGSNNFNYWQGMITGVEPVVNVAPTLLSPANLASNVCVTPTLAWNSVPTATSYRLQVSGSAAFTSTVYDNPALTSTSVTLPALTRGQTYYWRVNAAGPGGTSPWSTAWSFGTRAVTVTPAGPTTFCEGGSVQLNGSSSPGVTYMWTRNSSPIPGAAQSTYIATQSGSYALAIVDNGCVTQSDPVVVVATPLPIAEIITPISSEICQGQSMTLAAVQSAGCSYLWRKDGVAISGAITPTLDVTTRGLYDVVVTNSGCSSTSTPVSISVFDADPDTFVWTGAVNSDWSTTGNWDSPCAIPGSGDDVTVPSGTVPPAAIPPISLGTLTVDNAAGVRLGGTVMIEEQLDLWNGSVALGDNDLIIAATATIAGGSATRFVITDGTGALQHLAIGSAGRAGAVLFPVGAAAGSYTPVTLANDASANSFGVRVSDEVLSNGSFGTPVSTGVVDRTWHISAGTGQSNVSMIFSWTQTEELPGFDRTQCFISRNDAGMDWDPLQTAGAAQGSGLLTRMISGVTTFSALGLPFAIGSQGTLYPVELTSFTASVDNGHAHLQWTTVNEVNNLGFSIQKRSAGAATWTDAGFVAADATAADVHSYRWIDGKALDGVTEYRLAQIDLDGSVHHSGILAVGTSAAGSLQLGDVYPQPLAQGRRGGVFISSGTDGPVRLTLHDALGRLRSTVFSGLLVAGSARMVDLPSSDLQAGVYFLRLEGASGTQVRKFTIMR